jgi:hypothetical protein
MNMAARMCSNAKEGSICASPAFVRFLEGATDSASDPQSSVSEPQSSASGGRGGGCSAEDGCVSTDERKLPTTATACGVHHIREQTSTDVCAHIREHASAYVCVSRGVHHIKGKGPMELFDITLPATRTSSNSSSSSGHLLKKSDSWDKLKTSNKHLWKTSINFTTIFRNLQNAVMGEESGLPSIENFRNVQNAVVGGAMGGERRGVRGGRKESAVPSLLETPTSPPPQSVTTPHSAVQSLLETSDAWPAGMYATKRFFFSRTFESPEIESEFLESHVYSARLRCV